MPAGRPREFDRQEALHCATDVFWRKGFENTQIEDLLEAMGIGRGSMYAAFGDKRSLYLESLQAFVERAHSFYRDKILAGPESPFRNLCHFIARWPEMAEKGFGRGCFITNALMERAAIDEDVARITSAAIKSEELMIRGVLSEAQESGELPPTRDPAMLARAIVNARLGMTLQARLGASLAGVQAVSETTLALLQS